MRRTAMVVVVDTEEDRSMDPNACVNLINSTEDADELTEHVSNLLGWLQRGGFKPSVELEVVGHTNPSINFKLKRLVQLLGRAA